MNEIVTKIVVITIMFIGIVELCLFIVYGFFVKEKDVKEYLDKRDVNFELNLLNKNILTFRNPWDGKFIDKHVPLSFLSKYYIQGMGRVWRWSEGHKRIDNLFKKIVNGKLKS